MQNVKQPLAQPPIDSIVLKELKIKWDEKTWKICDNYRLRDDAEMVKEVGMEIQDAAMQRKGEIASNANKQDSIKMISELKAEFNTTIKTYAESEILANLKSSNFETQNEHELFVKFTSKEWRSQIDYENFRAKICSKIK